MKKILFIFAFLLATLAAEVGDNKWHEYVEVVKYEDALLKAAASKKMIMVMLSRKGCDACWYMKNVVFKDYDVQDLIENNFVFVHIDKNIDQIPAGIKYFAGPTFYFLDSAAKRVGVKLNAPVEGVLIGAENMDDFLLTLEEVIDTNKEVAD